VSLQEGSAQDRAAEVLGRLFDVRDRRVLVTGAASGLGFAFAEVLADCGARVMLADIDAELLEESTAALLARGLHARSQVVDVSDAAQVQGAVDRVVAEDGGLDVVFANAGIAAAPGFAIPDGQTIDAIGPGTLDAVMGVNFHGVMNTIASAAREMKQQRSGRIVVTSSVAGLRPEPIVCYGYVASKAAILNVVRQAALELAPHNVLVNAICPGPFKGTRIGGGATLNPDVETERMWSDTVPLGRMAEPHELKGLALMLASPAGSFITGAAHVIDGGVTLGGS
jgi:NAD(P)-dependent dehydrogenase (short-subunit alcohol dehydrogenase family)